MLIPLYGTKQASRCFYQKLVEKNQESGYRRSAADYSLYFTVRDRRLSLIASWVDDLIIMEEPLDVPQIEQDLDKYLCASQKER